MRRSVVEYRQNKSHVGLVRNIRTVVVKTSNNKGLRDFRKTQNMHNSASRYKLDTSYDFIKTLQIFWKLMDKWDITILIYPFLYDMNLENVIL